MASKTITRKLNADPKKTNRRPQNEEISIK